MTSEEYKVEEKDIFDNYDTPEEFRAAISHLAYEHGHAYGYNEILIHLEDITEALAKPILEYRKRFGK